MVKLIELRPAITDLSIGGIVLLAMMVMDSGYIILLLGSLRLMEPPPLPPPTMSTPPFTNRYVFSGGRGELGWHVPCCLWTVFGAGSAVTCSFSPPETLRFFKGVDGRRALEHPLKNQSKNRNYRKESRRTNITSARRRSRLDLVRIMEEWAIFYILFTGKTDPPCQGPANDYRSVCLWIDVSGDIPYDPPRH